MKANKKIRVLGKGLTAQAIAEQFDDVTLYDESDFNTYDKNSQDITVVSPGIPPHNAMVQAANNIHSDYDLFAQSMPYSVWISGTNGKTTTTQMMQHLLEKYESVCGGNIGTAVSKLPLSAKIWILETSSFTLHYTQKARPNLYVLLPISDDHISWHGSFEEYEASKLKAMDNMSEGEVAIIPSKYKEYPTHAYKITYDSVDDLAEVFEIDKSKVAFNEPFLFDAVLALGVSRILFDEIDYEKINAFKIDAHKVEQFKDKHNRLWIDDSKATNIDATLAALKPYEDTKVHLILGGDDKGADLIPLFEYLEGKELVIYSIGSNAQKIADLSQQFGIENFKCDWMKIAVEKIDSAHDKSSVAMLSPAAASLDQYPSYKYRGEEFKTLVQTLS